MNSRNVKRILCCCNNENVRASFDVSQPTAKKLHTIAEELYLLQKIMVSTIIDEKAVNDLLLILFSNETVKNELTVCQTTLNCNCY